MNTIDRHRHQILPIVLAFVLGFNAGCEAETTGAPDPIDASVDGNVDGGTSGAGTTSGLTSQQVAEATDPDGPTRYDKIFDGDVIHDLTVTYRPGSWDKQQADMVKLLGEFGAGGGAGGGGPGGGDKGGGDKGGPGGGGGGPGGGKGPPAEAFAACDKASSGDKCTVSVGGNKASGTCDDFQGKLACKPEGMGAGGGKGGGPGGDPLNGGTDLVKDDPAWVAVDVIFDGVPLKWAGLRYKGNSTLSSSWRGGVHKLPFRVTMDKFEDDHPETKNQRLWGFKKLTFAPAAKDASFLRDVLAGEVLRDRGVPSARTAFCRVFVDKGDGKGTVYAGLYIAIEDPANKMMKTVFGDKSGNLYKPDGPGATFAVFNQSSFVKKTNEDDADFSDVKAVVTALNADRSDAAAWRKTVDKLFDVDGFLRWLAVNSAMQNWDAYGRMTHNYYIYADPGQAGRLVWIPWDHNEAFTNGKGLADPMHADVDATWPLIRFLLDDPVFGAAYKVHLGKAIEGLYAEAAFEARAKKLHALIAKDVANELAPWTQLSDPSAFATSVQALVDHAKARRSAISASLAK